MLALTLIKSTGSEETAAISLDLGDLVKGLALTSLEFWRTATIRIASNAGAPDDAIDFVGGFYLGLGDAGRVCNRSSWTLDLLGLLQILTIIISGKKQG